MGEGSVLKRKSKKNRHEWPPCCGTRVFTVPPPNKKKVQIGYGSEKSRIMNNTKSILEKRKLL